MRWLGRKARAPLHFVRNVVVACWRHGLREKADRARQGLIRRVIFRAILSLETLLEGLFILLLVSVVLVGVATVLAVRWVLLEWRDTWIGVPWGREGVHVP